MQGRSSQVSPCRENKYASGSSTGGIKRTRIYLLTRQMSERGLIEIVGRGAGKRFRRILG